MEIQHALSTSICEHSFESRQNTRNRPLSLSLHYFPINTCVCEACSDLCNMQKTFSYCRCFVGPEVPNVVIMKIPIFRDVTPCGLVHIYWWYGGMCCLHPQERWVWKNGMDIHRGSIGTGIIFPCLVTLLPWIWRQHVYLKHQQWSTRHHGVTSWKKGVLLLFS